VVPGDPLELEEAPREGFVRDLKSAQRLRSIRVLWGAAAYGATALIAAGCSVAGLLEASRVVHFVIAAVVINATFLALIATGVNSRLRDPSLTGAQVIAALWPTIYVMYHVTEPQARMPFLLMAMVAMLFGVLALGFRRMLVLGAVVLGAYLLLLAALLRGAPERVDLEVEAVVVFAYAVVLLQVSFLGSFIAGLRRSLKERNLELHDTLGKLEELATRDPLTRLPNRRAVMQQLEREQSRLQRRHPGRLDPCVCLIDIDHFKRINDSYGHQVGDEVLRAVGGTIAATLRKGDFAGRLGGEEFLLLLPECAPAGALVAAERVRGAIAAIEVSGLPRRERIDVSIGIAVHRPVESLEGTLGRADRALYAAKQAGRARVVLDTASTDAPSDQVASDPADQPSSS
jgi:diguanylate cyclase (GGDEF)-like protein